MGNTTINNTTWMLSGTAIYSISQFIITIVIVRLGSVEDLGIFSLAMAISAPIMLLSNFGLRALWVSDIHKKYQFPDVFTLRFVTSFIALLSCACLALYMYPHMIALVIILIGLSKSIENQSDIIYAFHHRNKTQKLIAKSLIIRSIFGMASFAIGMFFGGLITGCLLYALSWFFSYYLIDYLPVKRKNTEQLKLNLSNPALYLCAGLPLGISFSLINLNLNIPRFILENEVGLHALGVFASIFFFVQIGSIVVNAIGQVLLRELAELYGLSNIQSHIRLVLKVLSIVFILSLTGVLFTYYMGDIMLKLVYGDELSKQSDLLILAFLLSPIQYSVSVMNNALVSVGGGKYILGIQTLTTIAVIIAGFILIPSLGIKGAFYSYSTAVAVGLACYFLAYFQKIKSCTVKC